MSQELQGLTSAEVKERVDKGMSNDFKARVGRSYLDIVKDNVFNLFNIVLFTLLLIVLLAQDYATVFFSGFSVFTNSILGMVQEIQAKRKLDRMAELAAQEVKVIRDGKQTTLEKEKVVVDDLIVIEPGDQFPVDGVVVRSDSLEVDESQLTGESDAVLKSEDDELHSGSFCIAGTGIMKATKVGKNSSINKLSTIAKSYKRNLTPTQKKLSAIVEISVIMMFIMAPMLLVAGFELGEEPIDIVRNTVVFVTSLVPQGLVLVAILSLTIGAVKISLKKTLIQRVNAVESLANVTVLCFDKTGTLTQNKLEVTEIQTLKDIETEKVVKLMHQYIGNLSHKNRTAGAISTYIERNYPDNDIPIKQEEIPFNSARKWGAIRFEDQMLVMGAPERILSDDEILKTVEDFSNKGMRVLAFATTDRDVAVDNVIDKCEPLAIIVMSDQIRDDIQATLDDFRQLNVKLKVISGDNVRTVRSIAKQSGMDTSIAYTGDELKEMGDSEFASAVREAHVFARIEPETKQRIVDTLRQHNEYVAMVGDGVNDVPALKAANLAIVMNDGTQISKDVADIVLLNNAMSTLPLAFREGRETTQTIFGTTKIFLTKNVYNILLFIFVGFMALPFAITPVQISWAAFGTVNMPATFIAFGIIRPKFIEKFRRDVLDYVLIAGVIGAIALAIIFAFTFYAEERNLLEARSAITIFINLYSMMIVWNVQGVELHNPRSFLQHWKVVIISSIAAFLTVLSFYAVAPLFEFFPPDPTTTSGMTTIILIVALFLLSMLMVDIGMRNRRALYQLWMLFDEQ